jgi:hypothetical protein
VGPQSVLLVPVVIVSLSAFPVPEARQQRSEIACEQEISAALTNVGGVPLPNGNPLGLYDAWMRFRFNRTNEALEKIDAAQRIVSGTWGLRLPPDVRKELISEVAAFRTCIATNKPSALATATVHTMQLEFDSIGNSRAVSASGILVTVNETPVGRTGTDGTLTVQVPPGPLRVEAIQPPTSWGEAELDLAPGATGTTTIVLDPEKEVGEDSDLVLAEAEDDIVPASSRSFTLRFMREGIMVPIAAVSYVDVEARDGTQPVTDYFTTGADGAVVATDPAKLFKAIAAHLDDTVTLRVYAEDGAGGGHEDEISFRVGQSRLTVTLAAPPSNPSLSVSNVPVAFSIVGAGIAIERVSDANGRIEIESFPHGNVGLECVTTSGGKYYYGQATLVLSGPRSVTLVLRHTSDLLKGVQPLVTQPAVGPQLSTAIPDYLRDLRRAKDSEAVPRLATLVSTGAIGKPAPKNATITSAGAGAIIEQATTVLVPKGMATVYLRYDVVTFEYHNYIDVKGAFDDVWTVTVAAADSGERLCLIRYNVASQDRYNPAWQRRPGYWLASSGVDLDVKALAANTDVLLTLAVSAVNARDELVPTMVRATLHRGN